MLKNEYSIYLYLSLININIYSNFTNNPKFKDINFLNYKYTLKFKRNFNRNKEQDIGDKNKLITKLDYIFDKNIDIGISLSKKQGEEFIFDNNTKRYFFNRYAYYINIKNLNFHNIIINNIVIGNFKIGYGQGLVFNYIDDTLNKPINITKIFKNQNGLIKSKSLKNKTFKGIGLSFNIKNISITLFQSINKLNAFIYNSEILSAKTSNSIKYNTSNNLKKKDKLKQYSFGYGINYIYNNFSIGSCFVFTKYNKNFNLLNNDDFNNNIKQLDNLFKSNKHYNFSFFLNKNINNYKFYIEYAHSLNPDKNDKNYGYCLITGFKTHLIKYLKYYFLTRYLSKKYHNFYGGCYSVKKGTVYNKFKGAPNNEVGFYNAFKIVFNTKNTLKLSSDYCLIPYHTFFFTKAFNKYYILDFFHKISFSELFNVQCKFNKENYHIHYKINEFKKIINNTIKLKLYLKKSINNVFLTKNYIFLTLNISKNIKKDDFGFAIYEKLNYKRYKTLNITFLFLYAYAYDKAKIYINRYEFNDKTRKFITINNHCIQLGTLINIKIYNNINLKGYYTFQYNIKKIEKTRYKNILCLNIDFYK